MAQIVRMLRSILIDQRLTKSEVAAVGIGIPAVLEQESDLVIWAPNISGWRDVPLRSTLEKELGLPVFVEYDGHTAVLGEYWLGAGRGYHNVVDVIVGTGIGGGLVLDGRLLRGFNRLAGAAGWFTLTTDAALRDERAQSVGYWESLAAGPGLALYANAQLDLHPGSILNQLSQKDTLTAIHVFSAAEQGDFLALQLLDQLADWLGLGLANIVSLVNPEVVILGGGMGSQCESLLPRIHQVILRWAQPISARSVKLKVSTLGARAGLMGAAYAAVLRLSQGF
jgi:glucokinase